MNNRKLDAAFAKHRAGDIEGATALYRAILAEQPQEPDALHMLGVIAQQKGNAPLALQLIEASLAVRDSDARAWNNRGLVLRVLGRQEEALVSSRHALSLAPDLADAWDLCGSLFLARGEVQEALHHSAEAEKRQPDNPSILNNRALTLVRGGDFCAAYATARKLEKHAAKFPPVILGNILKAAGHPKQAITVFEKIRRDYPHLAEAQINEALARLQIGDMDEGWRLWEQRPDTNPRFSHLPIWDGNAVDHLVVYEDQGLGDVFQCVRYLPLLRAKARHITLYVAPSLVSLLARNFPDISVRPDDAEVIKADARIRLLSLPAIYKTGLEQIPAAIPYLQADEKPRHTWRERLAHLNRPRIGLVWGGNPSNHKDHLRSVAFDLIIPFCTSARGHIISLQKGAQKNQADFGALDIIDADPWLDDFDSTAALIAELDLVVSVDTSVVHLAGALGVPVWMLTPFDPDFRWLLGREDNPWYPRLRLFRQSAPLDWSVPLRMLRENTQRLLQGNQSVLMPAPWNKSALQEDPNALQLE